MKSFDQWMKDQEGIGVPYEEGTWTPTLDQCQEEPEPETNCLDGDGHIYSVVSARAAIKQGLAEHFKAAFDRNRVEIDNALRTGVSIHNAIEGDGDLKWEEYSADKPDPDLEYQEGECCGCGANTEFHDGNYFYCGGSPRCCP